VRRFLSNYFDLLLCISYSNAVFFKHLTNYVYKTILRGLYICSHRTIRESSPYMCVIDRQIMHSLSKDAMRKLSERNSELLELARALEDKVAQHSQVSHQPHNVYPRIVSVIFFFEQTCSRLRQILLACK